ncbi:MAG: dephospho-CoA kinase, partial [Anaerovorax sp.]
MKIIGLTGGIGSGKTTVSNYLASKGYHVIDADKVAREVVDRNPEILKKFTIEFGTEILFEDGTLNRKKLGAIAFSDAEKKAKLDEIMHKEIIKYIEER